MFGNKAKGLTIVYEYGCQAPQAGLEEAREEMFLRNKLWNVLVETERKFRAELDKTLRSEYDDQVDAIKDQLAELEQEVRNHKQDAAFRTVDLHQHLHLCNDIVSTIRKVLLGKEAKLPGKKKYKAIPGMLFADFGTYTDLKQAIQTIRAELKPVYALVKAERQRLLKLHGETIKKLEADRAERVKTARQESGLYWGNYNDVIASYEMARKQAIKTHADLGFHSFHGEGKVTVQIIGGLPAAACFASNGQLQITPVPEEAWDKTLGRKRKKLQWAQLRLRVRSNPDRSPIWLELPVCLHRPIPAGAQIQGASVIRRKLGFAWKYNLVLTLRLPEPEPSSASTTTKISFCRTLGEDRSLTVAKVEQHGAVADVVLPATTTTQFEKLDDLRAIYGTYQAETQAALQTFANTQALPDWYKTETEHLYAWRSASRYLRLYRLWKDQRFAGDEEAFAKLEQFRERYRHLYSWESNLRDQLFRRRREQYRVIASQLVNTSGKIVIDELPAVTRKRAETESVVKTHQRRWDRIACRSVLKNTIESTARRQGVVIEVVSLAEQLGAVGSPGTARVA